MRRFPTAMAAVALIASTHQQAVAGLSGASTMRVQIDVYKGPVGQPIDAQAGELSALIVQATRAAGIWNVQARTLAQKLARKCASASDADADCRILQQGITTTNDLIVAICQLGSPTITASSQSIFRNDNTVAVADGCSASFLSKWSAAQSPDIAAIGTKELGSQLNATVRAYTSTQPPADTQKSNLLTLTQSIAAVASTMQIEAQRLAATNLAYVPRDKRVRSQMAELGLLLGDFSQRIAARNTVLYKLVDCGSGTRSRCTLPSKLPTSDYLRDSDPSQYIDVFRWFNASLSAFGTDVYKRGNRIEAITQLTEDYNWKPINEVYASGQGDVGMVFIKDELGNWNLKSFSNDPSDLLAAYSGAASAAIKTATSLLGGKSADVGKSNKFINFADKLTGGGGDTDLVDGVSLSRQRTETISRLRALQARINARSTELNAKLPDPTEKSIADALNKEEKAKTAKIDAQTKLMGAQTALEAARNNLSNCGTPCTAYENAVTNELLARQTLADAETTLRAATSIVDQRKAELASLDGIAATQAGEILRDYERLLSALADSRSSSSMP